MGLERIGALRQKISVTPQTKAAQTAIRKEGMRLNWTAMALAMAVMSMPVHALERVTVGIANSATDAGLFVADRKGYFKDEGLEVNFIAFDSGARARAVSARSDARARRGKTGARTRAGLGCAFRAGERGGERLLRLVQCACRRDRRR